MATYLQSHEPSKLVDKNILDIVRAIRTNSSSGFLLWTSVYRHNDVCWPAKKLHQLCTKSWCSIVNLPGANDDKEGCVCVCVCVCACVCVCVRESERERERERERVCVCGCETDIYIYIYRERERDGGTPCYQHNLIIRIYIYIYIYIYGRNMWKVG